MGKSKPKTADSAGTRRKSAARLPEALLAKIGRLDEDLIRLAEERARLVVEAARQDPAQAEALCAPTLDTESQERLAAAAGEVALPQTCVQALLREVASGCRRLIREPRIAFLGPLYSFSHLAAIHRFGQSVQLVPVGSIAAVFEEVHRKQSDFGLAPIENSTDGRVADTLDMFTRMRVRICGEVELRIHHSLLGKCQRTDVREVYSKPQALSQCRNWLAKHLPSARTIEVTSTSTAAQLASEKPGAAAIASVQAGVRYGLDVLAENIEDNPFNTTRFAVIGDHPSPRTGNDRTAVLFQMEHRPGTLADAMMIFKRAKLNLTWIESFPLPGPERGYLFFVEMEAHETDARCRRAMAALGRKALRLEILGSFPATAAVD
ncbi:MAG: prephenate dehydratase [Thermoguttaceae bacterium]|jgi:chorismate mutase/prephenate dehydratase